MSQMPRHLQNTLRNENTKRRGHDERRDLKTGNLQCQCICHEFLDETKPYESQKCKSKNGASY